MRQDDGSELLGANDPRSATIGVIHVAPNDDRQSVLAAILVQDKLGRKQVAVVLPEGENKAFQHAVDFDGLKSMRRGLKAQIVFVSPSGPGPAEFARQRRFPVYSSLENYARALQADGQGSTVIRRGWMFGRRQKPIGPDSTLPAPSAQTNGIEHEPTHPLPDGPVAPSEQVFTGNGAQADYEDEESHSDRNAALLGGAGLAAGFGLGALVAGEQREPGEPGRGSFTPRDDEDWDALPTPPAGGNGSLSNHAPMQAVDEPYQPPPATPSPSSAGNGAGPAIIAFPPPRSQGRITDKLPPIPAVVSAPAAKPHPPAIQSSGRRNSGKMAAVGAAGAAAGVGAVMAARGASVGAPPPPTRAGGGGAGGAGAASRRNRRRLVALGLILLTLLLIGGIILAAPGGLVPHTLSATVTITPANTVVSNTYSIDAVPGGATGKSQVGARILSSTKSQTGTVNATGTGHTPATQAAGSLTFYNALGPAKTIAAGTIITGADGVQVANNVAANIPAANPPTDGFVTVPAHAVNPGANGNIAVLDVSESCCAINVIVRNNAAFSGGQDSKTFTAVSQNDINRFAIPLETSLPAAARADVTNQKKANEQFVGSVTCSSPTVTSNPKVGQAATTVSISVSATCSGEVYDQAAAFSLAQTSLMTKASQNPGAGYALVGDIITTVKQANVVDTKGTVALLIFAEGRWVYQFTDTQKKTTLPNLIKGLTKSDALTKLMKVPGVSKASIDISGGGNTLPTDPTQISIVVQPIAGFQGTPTPTVGPSTPTGPGSTPTSVTSPTPIPTPTPVNGLGGSGGGS